MPLNPIEVVGGIAIGEGVGTAIGDVVEPQLRDLKNTQSAKFLRVPLPGEVAAQIIVKNFQVKGFDPARDATYLGLDGPRFAALQELARAYPGIPEALALWRRQLATSAQVYGWAQHLGYSDSIAAQLVGNQNEPGRNEKGDTGLFWDRLDPAVVATAIQRSIIPDAGILPSFSYTGANNPANWPLTVAAFASPGITTLDEARDGGIDRDRLLTMTALVGLPLSLEQAASAFFRGIIDRATFARAVAEGNTRIEWGPAALEQARQILTANQYAELQLRGFLTAPERRLKTDQHGMSREDSNMLFDVLGRSINVHQIVTGEARGGTYKPPPATLAEQTAGIPPAFLASLQRGNLRPEYYDLAYHNRYTYPSFFAIRGLLTGGVLNADEGYQILLEMGWKPSLARTVADFYGVPATEAKVDPLVKAARTQGIAEIRAAYLLGQTGDLEATTWLDELGVSDATKPELLNVWRVMREVPQKGLTAPQIVKAFHNLPAQWPRQRALDELQLLGLTADDAATLLDE